ncbi:hypothetical protein ACP4OV_022718 [Aristida adscensionis]
MIGRGSLIFCVHYEHMATHDDMLGNKLSRNIIRSQ